MSILLEPMASFNEMFRMKTLHIMASIERLICNSMPKRDLK